MRIESFAAGILGTNCYFIINEQTRETIVVDPGGYSKRMKEFVAKEELCIVGILLTHGHFDHMMGVPLFREEKEVPVYIYDGEDDILGDPELNLSSIYTRGMTVSDVIRVHDGQTITMAGFTCCVLFTPGHTTDGCCYYFEKEKVLLSGDTLFQASVGRSDLPTSREADLIRSIKEKLMALPDDVKVLPGHMGATTIGDERRLNPFL